MADQMVTDPAVLAQLEGHVTDPSLIAQLEGQSAGPSTWDELKHMGGMAARVGVNTVAALPYMAMDAGVSARNTFGKLTGIGGTDYTLPSEDLRKFEDEHMGKPQGTLEKITDAVGPMAMGVGAAGSKAPGLIKAMLAPTPEAGVKVPSNFMTPDQTKTKMLADALKARQADGFVVPPSTTNPTIKNQMLERIAGKIATQQKASTINQEAANALAAKANGLNPDAPLTADSLGAVRSEAGKAYKAVRGAGDIPTDDKYLNDITAVAGRATGPARSFPGSKTSPLIDETDSMLVPKFDAGDAVDKIDDLRNAGKMAYRAGDTSTYHGYKQLSQALEEQMERSLEAKAQDPTSGVSSGMVSDFKNARQAIAVSHDTEKALVPGSSDVNMGKLAQALNSKKMPASSPLAPIGQFAAQFPKAAQVPSKMGSQVSHTDMLPAMISMTEGEGALGKLAGFAWPVARKGATAYLMGPGQKGAVPKTAEALADLGPTKAKAAAIAQALAQFEGRPEHDPAAVPAY